jgi:exo-beta-1,3-glucanase (GH17 family)
MESDIALLSKSVKNIRIYSGSNTLGNIPELAKKQGLTVWLGAWLDSNHETNWTEIEALVNLANHYPQTITRVIVGNENLHRMDLTPSQLRDYLIRVKDSIAQPVSYADGWEYWLDHSEIVDAVDIITVHILPYWEQTPKPVEELGAHVEGILSKVSKRYPDKPLAIGEIGWPTFGRSRKAAIPGIPEQAQLIAEVHSLAQKMDLDYNIIEAFDQPWKGLTEGSAGAYWGLFTAEREEKNEQGEKNERYPNWQKWFALSAIGAMIFAFATVFTSKIQLSTWKLLGISVISYVLLSMIVLSGLYLSYAQAVWIKWTIILLQLYFTYLLLIEVSRPTPADKKNTSIGETLANIRPQRTSLVNNKPTTISLIYYCFTYIGLIVLWGMVLQSRYRDFPIVLFLVPTFGIWLSAIFSANSVSDIGASVIRILNMKQEKSSSLVKQRLGRFREETFTVVALCLGAILVVIGEGIENLEAVWFSLTFVVLASPYLGMLLLRK